MASTLTVGPSGSGSTLKSPTPFTTYHHPRLVLNNPFTNADDDPEDGPSRPLTPSSAGAFRAHLQHLLPRHAFFRVHLQIHEVTNIPLVSGEFCVRWKFKNVHSAPGTKSGFLGIGKGRLKTNGVGESTSMPSTPTLAHAPGGSGAKGKGRMKDDEGDSESFGSTEAPSIYYEDHPAKGTNHAPSISSSASTRSTSSSGGRYSGLLHASSSSTSTRLPSTPSASANGTKSNSQALPQPLTVSHVHSEPFTTSARGQTHYVKLKDHNVTWEHGVDVVVRMDIDRDTTMLHPSLLKLVVMQRVDPDDPGSTRNPRLGAVYLNLAEFACKGEVQRRYLLQDSKINAVLKTTLELDHISGPTNFYAPPLPKTEILSGITGILENDVYRSRPTALDFYGSYYDQLNGEGSVQSSDGATSAPPGRQTPNKPVFNIERLPLAYGPATTETLIEALFNPLPTTKKEKESPFTIYVEPAEVSQPVAPEPRYVELGYRSSPNMVDRSDSAKVGKTSIPRRPPPPVRGGSGIGAGLGIMGLGMGMGIGMGIGVGVDSSRPGSRPGVVNGTSGQQSTVHKSIPMGGGRRQLSQGEVSVTPSTVSSSTSSGEGSLDTGDRGAVEDDDGPAGKKGVRGWWRRKVEGHGTGAATPDSGLSVRPSSTPIAMSVPGR